MQLNPFSSFIIYLDFYTVIFMCKINSVMSFNMAKSFELITRLTIAWFVAIVFYNSFFSNLKIPLGKQRVPAGNYKFKVNNRNIRTRCEICSKLTIKIPERRQWRRSGIFIVNFEHISQLVLVFLLLNLSR